MDHYRYEVRTISLDGMKAGEVGRVLNQLGAQGYHYRDLVPVSRPSGILGADAAGVTTDLIVIFEQIVPGSEGGGRP